jgi:hydroxymethylpyrimidine pyrophosphatase-like HAD family hydrolase/CheY-like chemotaxis protein
MRKEHILIVEDSLGVSRALRQALSLPQGGGYQVEVCDSGEAAMERLQDTSFDLLISDLRLPGMNGLELLDRAHHTDSQMRSVLITAFGSPQVEERARHLADAYLPKPFRLQEMIRIVQRVLGEPAHYQQLSSTQETVPDDIIGTGKTRIKRSSHLTVLACGLEGVLAEEDGRVAIATWEALRRAKNAGMSIVLVTSQTWESFSAEGHYAELCEAIVAEGGAVVYFPRRDTVALPFGRLAPRVLQSLDAAGVPLQWGRSTVSTHVPHDKVILKVLQETGSGVTMEYNRGSMMVLPPGATKGTGLRYALRELGYSPRNVVACGDAENDQSLFEVAELAVAVSNALPHIQAQANVVLPQANGTGIETLVTSILDGYVPYHRPRPDRRLLLGHDLTGSSICLDPFSLVNSNLGIFGGSGSGKSWLAGLLVEGLLKQEYQVCIIDPEGDYRALGASPQSLLLGGPETQLSVVADVVNFLECSDISLVLDLSVYEVTERIAYLWDLLRALQCLRARRGRPHWFLIDEVQSFCSAEQSQLGDLLLNSLQEGGFGLVSYRPSHVAPEILKALDCWLLTRLSLPEELTTLTHSLPQQANSSETISHLPTLPIGQAYLYADERARVAPRDPNTPHQPRAVRFYVGERTVPHVRHLRKYLRAPLPRPKMFYFCDTHGHYLDRTAANLWEFREALSELPIETIRYHLGRGDFERWLKDVLHDDELAHRVRKVNSRSLEKDSLRQALLEVVIDRYDELDRYA